RPASPHARTGSSGPDRAGSPSTRPDRVPPRRGTTWTRQARTHKQAMTTVSCFPPKDLSIALLEAAVVESQAMEGRSGLHEPGAAPLAKCFQRRRDQG